MERVFQPGIFGKVCRTSCIVEILTTSHTKLMQAIAGNVGGLETEQRDKYLALWSQDKYVLRHHMKDYLCMSVIVESH